MGLYTVDIIKGDGIRGSEDVDTTFVRIPVQPGTTRNHWAMFFRLGDGTWMKVDLLSLGYRIIYEAEPDPLAGFIGTDHYYRPTQANAEINGNRLTRGRVLSGLLLAKKEHDKWIGAGENRFDCQDFVKRMIEVLQLEVTRTVEHK